MTPGDKVLIFGKHHGAVVKQLAISAKALPDHQFVQWKEGNVTYRAHVALTDLKPICSSSPNLNAKP